MTKSRINAPGLARAISGALDGSAALLLSPRALPVSEPGEARHMLATVLPLPGPQPVGTGPARAAAAAVFLQDLAAAPPPTEAFSALYGPTPAENRFLGALASGNRRAAAA